MLKYYEIENFKSFKEKARFSLEKTNYKVLEDRNIKGDILKGIMLVGGNASGKSTALLPVKLLLDLLFAKEEIILGTYHCFFSVNPITTLKYVFDIEGTEIEYYIEYSLENDSIFEILKIDNQSVLERKNGYARVSFTEKKEFTDVQANTLFLREVYFNTKFRGNILLQKWFLFLSRSIFLDLYSKEGRAYHEFELRLDKYLEKFGTEEINRFFENYNFGQTVEYDIASKGRINTFSADNKQIYLKRKGIDEPIPYEMESTGNQNLLQLLPPFFDCVNSGGLLILDEFSSGFHNELEILLIKFFMRNAKNSQILFVSHSTNLLSSSILRPDQLYSVGFDNSGSHIKRFSSEKPREAQNLEKMYLGGVFGGLPRYKNENN